MMIESTVPVTLVSNTCDLLRRLSWWAAIQTWPSGPFLERIWTWKNMAPTATATRAPYPSRAPARAPDLARPRNERP